MFLVSRFGHCPTVSGWFITAYPLNFDLLTNQRVIIIIICVL